MVGTRRALTGAGAALLAAASLAVASGSAAAAGPFLYAQTSGLAIAQFSASGTGLAALSPATVTGRPGASPGLVTVPAVTPDGRSLYVPSNGLVSQYDIAADGTVTPKAATSVAAGTTALAVAVNPDGRSAYVANFDDNTISQYDVGTDGALTPKSPATVATGAEPASIAVSPDGRTAYVANFLDGTIAVDDIGADGGLTPRPSATVTLDQTATPSLAIAPDGRSLYAVSGNSFLYAFDIAADGTLTPKTQARTTLVVRDGGGNLVGLTLDADGIAISPDGRDLYLGDNGGGNMSHVRLGADGAATVADLAPVPASGARTDNPVVAPDGRSVYASNNVSPNIVQYDRAADGSLTLKTPANVSIGSAGAQGAAITPSSDLSLRATAAPGPVGAGRALTATFTVTNSGTPATGVAFDQPVGSDVVLVSATSSQGTCNTSGSVHCALGALADGGSATVTVKLQPLAAGTLTEQPTVSATQPDPDASNNSADTTATVFAAPLATTGAASDLTPTGATLNGVVLPNGRSTGYHFEYGVDGALDLRAPASDVDAGDGTDGVAVSAPVAELLPATTYTYRVVADDGDGNPVNGDTRTFTTPALPVPSVDLGLSGTAAPSGVSVGDLVTFSWTVTNGSLGDAAHDVRIVDPLPGGATFSAAGSTAGCTLNADATAVTCDVGTLAAGGSATVAVAVHAGQAGVLVSTAVASADEPDPVTTNDLAVAQATVTAPQQPDDPGAGNPAPGGPGAPAPKPIPAKATLRGTPAPKSGAVRATLACAGATCSGTVTLTTSVRTVVRVHGKKTTRTRVVTLGSARYTLAAGRTGTVTVKLTRSGRALLTRSRKLTATLAVRLGTNAKARPVVQRKLVLRPQGAPRR